MCNCNMFTVCLHANEKTNVTLDPCLQAEGKQQSNTIMSNMDSSKSGIHQTHFVSPDCCLQAEEKLMLQ